LKDIERCERLIVYENIDDISKGLDVQIVNFSDYREITSKGFKELLALHEDTKDLAVDEAKKEA